MSDKTPRQNDNEEIDLGQLFNAIGRLFEKLFNFIGKIFKGIFTTIILILKPLVEHFKLIAVVLMAAAVIGYVVDKFKEPVYKSNMIVKPYFDSKYQLVNNVDYFNALINSKNLKELSKVFEIDTLKSSNILEFEIEAGPETQNDLLIEYDEYLQDLDTSLVKDFSFEKFVENRDMLSSSIFSITAKSKSANIFPQLEKGFIKTFENKYSKKLKQKFDSIYGVEKANYLAQLQNIDKLQNMYIEIKTSEANNGKLQLSTGSLLPLSQEKVETKEFELFQEEVKIRQALKNLEEIKIEEQDYYDIIASFDEIGKKDSRALSKLTFLLPLIIFSIMVIAYALMNIFKFIKNYEK